jgi:glycosyltransferase involved in cell wall biosynthesis
VDLLRARALLYLTRSEGLGSGILLAMALGVTVIASNTGGIPELITNGRNGILVDNDAAAVQSALTAVLSGGNSSLGHAARETVRERFTEKHMVDATLAAYRKALA